MPVWAEAHWLTQESAEALKQCQGSYPLALHVVNYKSTTASIEQRDLTIIAPGRWQDLPAARIVMKPSLENYGIGPVP